MGRALEAVRLPLRHETALVAVGLLLVGIFLVKTVASIGIQGAIVRFSLGQRARLQTSLMRSYQRLPYTEFLQRNSSEFVHSIEALTEDFASLVQMGLRTLSDALVTILLLALLAWQNAPALALLIVLVVAVVFAYDRLFRRKLWTYGELMNSSATAVMRGVNQGIEGLKEIRILGAERHFHEKVKASALEYSRSHGAIQVAHGAPRYLLELTMVVFVVALVLLNMWLGGRMETLMPTLGMFAVAALRLLPAASTFSSSLVRMRACRDSVSRLHADIDALSRATLEPPGDRDAGEPVLGPFDRLSIECVSFTYPGATRPALRELSLEVRPREALGLIGPSGSGKTTLVDLLLGLLRPTQGDVRYNGRPLAECLAEWRTQVAYLPQQVFLIDDTLRRNVALGLDDAAIDGPRFEEALRQARLHEVVSALPKGADTVIGERGVRLSGGQRQRVALARAFYHGRDVLVMDEATSSLDPETELEIVEEIRRLKGHKTLIVIAHRESTVMQCDRICKLEQGRIVQEGHYNEFFPR